MGKTGRVLVLATSPVNKIHKCVRKRQERLSFCIYTYVYFYLFKEGG